MTISPYEDSYSRIWIDNITVFTAVPGLSDYMEHGEVYADVSDDLKTITIPVPQQVQSTASEFGLNEPFILYKNKIDYSTGEVENVLTESTITFKLQKDGSWKTTDPYGYSVASEASLGMFIPVYMNCFSDFLPDDYPTMFVKNKASAPKAASPSRSTKRTFALPKKIDVRPPFLPEKASHKLNK